MAPMKFYRQIKQRQCFSNEISNVHSTEITDVLFQNLLDQSKTKSAIAFSKQLLKLLHCYCGSGFQVLSSVIVACFEAQILMSKSLSKA